MRTALLIAAEARPEDAAEAAEGLRPMPDYLALAARLGAELIDRRAARAGLPRAAHALARRAGSDLAQAILAFHRRREFECFVCDSERIGLPLAVLLHAAQAPHPVYFIGHRLTSRWKQLLWRHGRAGRRVAGVFCYADAQMECLRRLRLGWDGVHRMAFHADHRFWVAPPEPPEAMILSVGQEHRDYATLVQAARSLPVPVRILARSPWSRTRLQPGTADLPENARFLERMPYLKLREMYVRAAIVAVPIQACDFQAGITSLLEAMAMGRPVVATENPGLREVFAEREAGLWVPPGDAPAMAAALTYLLKHPREAAEMGRRGRVLVEEGMTLDHWVERIAGVVHEDAHRCLHWEGEGPAEPCFAPGSGSAGASPSQERVGADLETTPKKDTSPPETRT